MESPCLFIWHLFIQMVLRPLRMRVCTEMERKEGKSSMNDGECQSG